MLGVRKSIWENSLLATIAVIFLLISVKDLAIDVVNPDGINWHVRTKDFTDAISRRNFGSTYRVYHPGVMLMWLSGPVLNLFTPNTDIPLGQKSVLFVKDYYAKLSLVVFVSLLFFLDLILFKKLFGFKFVFIFSALLGLEPFLVGMRRLYHLDYLMSVLLLTSVIFLYLYLYRKNKFLYLVLSIIFFVAAFLTKSLAVVFLSGVPFLILFSKLSLKNKIISILIYFVGSLIIFYAMFPAVWRRPMQSIPNVLNKIYFGISVIGYEGRKELGRGGESENLVLKGKFGQKDPNFYLLSLAIRSSFGLWSLSILAVVVLILTIVLNLKFSMLKDAVLNNAGDFWFFVWNFGISLVFFIVLTISTKKSDRYEVIILVFLITLVSYILTSLKPKILLPILFFYVLLVYRELVSIHPYYVAYSNPRMGGISWRLNNLTNEPFGVGIHAAVSKVREDFLASKDFVSYSLSAPKSAQPLAYGGRFYRTMDCTSDYIIAFSPKDEVEKYCGMKTKYNLIGTVKVQDFDYWNIYKRYQRKLK